MRVAIRFRIGVIWIGRHSLQLFPARRIMATSEPVSQASERSDSDPMSACFSSASGLLLSTIDLVHACPQYPDLFRAAQARLLSSFGDPGLHRDSLRQLAPLDAGARETLG